MNKRELLSYKKTSVLWAQGVLARGGEYIIFDTETTGLTDTDEIIQIGAVDALGHVLLNNVLIKPTCPISEGATNVHHLDALSVIQAPPFHVVWPDIVATFSDRIVLAYNYHYDMAMLESSARVWNIPFELGHRFGQDVMRMYAQFVGKWNPVHESFRWQKLPEGDHSALGDCRATLGIIHEMAEYKHA